MSKAEQLTSRALRTMLGRAAVGDSIQQFAEFLEFLSGLEWLLPKVLEEIHPEWKWESLDGFQVFAAHRTWNQEAELTGYCILITDQTLTPFHLRLQIAPAVDEISWLELKLGERSPSGMVRLPYSAPPLRWTAALKDGIDTIDWVYKVTYGERRV